MTLYLGVPLETRGKRLALKAGQMAYELKMQAWRGELRKERRSFLPSRVLGGKREKPDWDAVETLGS